MTDKTPKVAEINAESANIPLDEIQKKIDEMLAKAQAAANEIVAKAQEKAKEIINTAENDKTEQEKRQKDADFEAYMNELVPVYLFKDNNKYRDDVMVAVNGETILIQRGKHVMIRRKFAHALENSQMQDAFAAEHMMQLAEQYKNKENMLS